MLLIAGCAFAITACAYGVMTVRQLQKPQFIAQSELETSSIERDRAARGESFNKLVDQHGPMIMIVELILLGVGTFGAMAYDQHLDGKDKLNADESNSQPTQQEPS